MRTLPVRVHRAQRGVTLIELLVALAVFALFILMIDAVFSGARTNARKTEVAADVQQNARIAVSRITRELREAASNQVVYGTDASGQGQIVFKSARLGADNTVFCLYTRATSGLGYDPRCLSFSGGVLPTPPSTASPCDGTTIPCGTYTPLWRQFVGYCAQGPDSNGLFTLQRMVGDLSLPNQSVAISMVAPCGGDTIASSIQSFGIGVSNGTVSVSIQGLGTQKVQGRALPAQQIALPSRAMPRN